MTIVIQRKLQRSLVEKHDPKLPRQDKKRLR